MRNNNNNNNISGTFAKRMYERSRSVCVPLLPTTRYRGILVKKFAFLKRRFGTWK